MIELKPFVLAVSLLAVAGCSNTPDYDAQDDATCRASFDPASEEYHQCRQALAQRREAECEAVRTVVESPRLQPPPTMPPPMAIRR